MAAHSHAAISHRFEYIDPGLSSGCRAMHCMYNKPSTPPQSSSPSSQVCVLGKPYCPTLEPGWRATWHSDHIVARRGHKATWHIRLAPSALRHRARKSGNMKIGWKSKQHIKNPNQIGNPENYQIFRSNCYEKYNDGTRLIMKTHWKRPPTIGT